jgi:hypothetical protein
MKMIIAIVALASALGAQTSPPREPVARIGDQTIYDEDLLPSIAGQLWQLKNHEYELKSKALVNVVNQRLLEAAAKSKGLSTDAFLEQTVDRNVPPASAAIKLYLPSNSRGGQAISRCGIAKPPTGPKGSPVQPRPNVQQRRWFAAGFRRSGWEVRGDSPERRHLSVY